MSGRRGFQGVTLIEMVIVISITAIIAGAVAVFIARPIEGYHDATRRAEMTDVADTALRRMTRDLRTALPNSIRIATLGSVVYLEFLQTTGGGRYRAEVASDGSGDALSFSAPDNSFDVIGDMPVPAVAVGDSIVVYNLNSSGGVANAYSGDNRRTVAGSGASSIAITPTALPYPLASPAKRFQVVQHAVTYVCDPGTRQLRRYWNYGISPAQATPPATPNNALLASDVIACAFTYTNGGSSGRTGVVTLEIRVERNGESVHVFQQVHVSNVP